MQNEHQTDPRHADNSSHRVMIGVLLIVAGMILILKKTTVLPAPFIYFIDRVVFTWQMLLIVIGIISMTSSANKTPGIVMVIIGGFFLIPKLFSSFFWSINFFWPAMFIALGVILILNSDRMVRRRVTNSDSSRADFIDYVNIFSGAERQFITDNFMGGKIVAIFGGGEVDLTRSSLAPGENVIDITCIFGGTTIVVPENWNVIVRVTPILGGFSDSRKLAGEVIRDHTRSLIISGTVIFGGGEIKCTRSKQA